MRLRKGVRGEQFVNSCLNHDLIRLLGHSSLLGLISYKISATVGQA